MDTSEERYYHGTHADLKPGDLIEPGYNSNYGSRRKANHVYLTATQDAAVWGAELADGEGSGRIYIVEPTGAIGYDPNLTDKRFPGNPTKFYRHPWPDPGHWRARGLGGACLRGASGDEGPPRTAQAARH